MRLAHLPTPLEPMPRLSAALGGPRILIKRDDLTGLAFGGNKTRQLEFLFADIVATGADTIVAGAYTQSNWCRQITAAAAKHGLAVELVLVHGVKGPRLQGNLLLDKLMGAKVTVVDIDDIQRLPPLLEAKVEEQKAKGRKPYLVSPFGLETLALSAVGYVNAVCELDSQLAEARVRADYVYLSGANITPAGILVGARALGWRTRVVAISPVVWEVDRATDIARIANATARLLGLDETFAAADLECHETYMGPKYGVVTDACRRAIRLAAEMDGVILDPVYTGKAMAALIEHARERRFGAADTVVFIHSGGLPALFAYAEDLGL
ncbi:MAG: D-cysteine desulfhydrase family protein [Alphaproteobacteria bacterium]